MAHAERDTRLSLHRDGQALRLSGPLDRDAVTTAWPDLLPRLDGARVLDLGGVTRLDSAGVALLVEAAARMTAGGVVPDMIGAPAALADLRAAYRLDSNLAYADSAP